METPSSRSVPVPEISFPLFWGCADRLGFWTPQRRTRIERWLKRHGIHPRPSGRGRCCGQVAFNLGEPGLAERMARAFPEAPLAVASMSCTLHLRRYGIPAEEITLFLLRRGWLPHPARRVRESLRVLFFAGCHARSGDPDAVQELYHFLTRAFQEISWTFPELPVCCGFAGAHSFMRPAQVAPVTLEILELYGSVDRVVGVDPPCLDRIGRWMNVPVDHVLTFLASWEDNG